MIPAEIRKKFNLDTDTKLQWIEDGLSIRVVRVDADPINTARGVFGKTKLTKALLAGRKRDRERG